MTLHKQSSIMCLMKDYKYPYKLEFEAGVNDENIIYDWWHDGSGKNNSVPTAKTRFTE